MNLNDLTSSQLIEIFENKEKFHNLLKHVQEKEKSKILKIGYLKYDLFYFYEATKSTFDSPNWLVTEEIKIQIINNFSNNFKVKYKKGDKFVLEQSFQNKFTKTIWHPENNKYCFYDSKFEKHLENIQVF